MWGRKMAAVTVDLRKKCSMLGAGVLLRHGCTLSYVTLSLLMLSVLPHASSCGAC